MDLGFSNRSPEAHERFLVRDLDNGKDIWIEESDTGRQLREQSTAKTHGAKLEKESRKREPIRRSSSERKKRTQSDELLQKESSSLRSADHVRVKAQNKREREFAYLYRWQSISAHQGAIRVLRFNSTGKMLATAGTDGMIKIWDVDARGEDTSTQHPAGGQKYQRNYLRNSQPKMTLIGHNAEVIDMSWSRNNFIVSGGMDRMIRLWHPTSQHCLRAFSQKGFVTTVAFHPHDEQICISGSSDGALRLWHMKEEKLLSEAEVDDLISACAITPDGTTVLIGTLHGRCKFFGLFDEVQGAWQFNHTTQLDVRSRRARNGFGRKIAGFCFHPTAEEVLISSNDSRIRQYRLDDKAVLSKFMGHQNDVSQLTASFSPCGRYVLSGSETRTVCIWEVKNSVLDAKARREGSDESDKKSKGNDNESKYKNIAIEAFSPHDHHHVAAAVFAPRKAKTPKSVRHASPVGPSGNATGLVIVSGSEHGEIRVFGCG